MLRPETKARARALQLLYAWDMTGRPSLDAVVARVAVALGRPPEPDPGAKLAEYAIAHAGEFDKRVTDAAQNWRFERVGIVERNVLRLALAELVARSTPPRVVIDEAVKLAQWFAGPKAPGFVNGVLDTIARELGLL